MRDTTNLASLRDTYCDKKRCIGRIPSFYFYNTQRAENQPLRVRINGLFTPLKELSQKRIKLHLNLKLDFVLL